MSLSSRIRACAPRPFPLVLKNENITSNVVQAFGDGLTLIGYGGEARQMEDGTVRVPFYTQWTCEHPLTRNYTLFIHYVNDAGDIQAQGDHGLGARFELDSSWMM